MTGYRRLARPMSLVLIPPWRVERDDLHLADLEAHSIGEHRHHDHELMLIRRGTWSGMVDGRALTVRAPALLHVQPGQAVTVQNSSAPVFFGFSTSGVLVSGVAV